MSMSVRFMLDERSPTATNLHLLYSPGLVLDERTPHADGQAMRRAYGESSNPFGLEPFDGTGALTVSQRGMKKSSRNLSQSARVVPTSLAKVNVLIVGPGAGIGHNGESYWKLKQESMFTVKVFGRSGMPYDHYPPDWPDGQLEPNLATFAQDMAANGQLEDFDCLIFGSRGGQVVLPCLWQMGIDPPPALVINGGCALEMPRPVSWPANAVTLLLMGGKDYFRKPHVKPSKYVNDAKHRVSTFNNTTALLYVHEMAHMPAAEIMDILLKDGICALIAWKSTGQFPRASFQTILAALAACGYHACLSYKADGRWLELQDPSQVASPLSGRTKMDSAYVFPFTEGEASPLARSTLPVRSGHQSPSSPSQRSSMVGSPMSMSSYARSMDGLSTNQWVPSQASTTSAQAPSPYYSYGCSHGSMKVPPASPTSSPMGAKSVSPTFNSARSYRSLQLSPKSSMAAYNGAAAYPSQLTPRSRQAKQYTEGHHFAPASQASMMWPAASMPLMLPWVATR